MQSNSGGVREEEVSIQCTLIAKKSGNFVLGPARFNEIPGSVSGSARIEVIDGFKEEHTTTFEEPTLSLELSKSEVYVGEKVPFTLRFLWQDPNIKPVHIEIPELPGAQTKEVSKGSQKMERRGNQVYHVLEFTGLIYPERAGIVRIPHMRADYTIGRSQSWPSFFQMGLADRESAFSSSVRLTVHELPPYAKPVAGVGKLSHFKAVLSNQKFPRGEAATLTLSVEGEADFDTMVAPVPQLPSSFRSYPSETKNTSSQISWSYVLQGLEEGTYTIPSQELIYFDLHAKSYKTLRTEALSCTITPGAQSKNLVPLVLEEQTEATFEPVHEQLPTSGGAYSIPFTWFILLLLIPPLVCAGIFLVSKVLIPFVERFITRRRTRTALQKGASRVHQLEKHGKGELVYEVVRQSLAQFFSLHEVDDEEIMRTMRNRGYDQKLCTDTKDLLEDSLKMTSYAPSSSRQKQDLWRRTYDILKRIGSHKGILMVVCMWMVPVEATTFELVIRDVSQIVAYIPFVVWQVGVLIGWWLLWLFLPRRSSEIAYVIMGVWLLCLVGWAFRLPHELYPPIRVSQETPLYVGPADTYPSRAQVVPHDELALVKSEGAWYYVSSRKGKGWVPAAHVKVDAAL
jgi:hypothetical protein